MACSASSSAARAAATAASLLLGLRHHGQRLPRLIERTGLDIATHEAGERRHIGCVLGEELRVHLRGAGGIAFGERGVGRFEQILGFAADAVLGQPLEKGDDLAFRQRPHETIGRADR